jgi:hypothetical protein
VPTRVTVPTRDTMPTRSTAPAGAADQRIMAGDCRRGHCSPRLAPGSHRAVLPGPCSPVAVVGPCSRCRWSPRMPRGPSGRVAPAMSRVTDAGQRRMTGMPGSARPARARGPEASPRIARLAASVHWGITQVLLARRAQSRWNTRLGCRAPLSISPSATSRPLHIA